MTVSNISRQLEVLGMVTATGGAALLLSVVFAGSGVVLIAAGTALFLFGSAVGLFERRKA